MVDWTTSRPLAFKCFMISLSAAYMSAMLAEAKRPDDYVLTNNLDVHALVIRDGLDEFTGIV